MRCFYNQDGEASVILFTCLNSFSHLNSDSLGRYTPVRSDSVVGELRLSGRTDIILPGNRKILPPLSFCNFFICGSINILRSFSIISLRDPEDSTALLCRKSSRGRDSDRRGDHPREHRSAARLEQIQGGGQVSMVRASPALRMTFPCSRPVNVFPNSPLLLLMALSFRFIAAENGGAQSFEPLPSQRSCSYKLHLKDVGRCLKCECIAADVFGRSSEPVSAVTSPILPGYPRSLPPFFLFLFFGASSFLVCLFFSFIVLKISSSTMEQCVG